MWVETRNRGCAASWTAELGGNRRGDSSLARLRCNFAAGLSAFRDRGRREDSFIQDQLIGWRRPGSKSLFFFLIDEESSCGCRGRRTNVHDAKSRTRLASPCSAIEKPVFPAGLRPSKCPHCQKVRLDYSTFNSASAHASSALALNSCSTGNFPPGYFAAVEVDDPAFPRL